MPMHKSKNTLCFLFLVLLLGTVSCTRPSDDGTGKEIPVIGFIDYVEDVTLEEARKGFFDALNEAGFCEDSNTLAVIYRNAQGDQPTLLQAVDYIISREPRLLAANTTLATITAVQRSKHTPVFMMVAPRPDIAGLTNKEGLPPPHLFGVYETLDYIDTSVTLIRQLFPHAKKVGTIYSQSESQSTDALSRLQAGCKKSGILLEAIPVSNSSETQLIAASLISKNIDVFFALPDNVVFSSFEAIARLCREKNIPVLTSEAGLVARGALASFGADMYQWGYQSGEQAAYYLKMGNTNGIKPEIVRVRRKVINKNIMQQYGIAADSTFVFYP